MPRGRAGGHWGSRMGGLRWPEETWVWKEGGGRGCVRKEGAVAQIGKALEHRTGSWELWERKEGEKCWVKVGLEVTGAQGA